MNAILLILVIFGVTIQHITKKIYTKKTSGGAYTFTAIGTLAALLFFIVTSGGDLHFTSSIIPYSIGFAATYCMSLVFTLLSIKEGPLSITTLITSYSLLIPTLFGLIAWNEPFFVLIVVGLVLLVISIFLIRFEGVSKKSENLQGELQKSLSGKWLLYVILAFIGSGGCSTVQKGQQIAFKGAYKNEFMILALAITFFAVLICALISERRDLLQNIKHGLVMASIGGIANGAVNFFVLILSLRMAASVMFPIISAGGILCSTAISIGIYKERISLPQKIGVALGILAIVVLNI